MISICGFWCAVAVVKLFNAVSKQQKIIKEKLEEAPTEAKREKGMMSA